MHSVFFYIVVLVNIFIFLLSILLIFLMLFLFVYDLLIFDQFSMFNCLLAGCA